MMCIYYMDIIVLFHRWRNGFRKVSNLHKFFRCRARIWLVVTFSHNHCDTVHFIDSLTRKWKNSRLGSILRYRVWTFHVEACLNAILVNIFGWFQLELVLWLSNHCLLPCWDFPSHNGILGHFRPFQNPISDQVFQLMVKTPTSYTRYWYTWVWYLALTPDIHVEDLSWVLAAKSCSGPILAIMVTWGMNYQRELSCHLSNRLYIH